VTQPLALAAAAPTAPVDGDLATTRDRLTERFAVMQSELGGTFYEMAIRDHVRIDVLMRKAAELQRIDAELAQVERILAEGALTAHGRCPSCAAIHARGAAFCAQCAHPLLGP
jgi:alkylhydroperoxidase/carboxymuconolactone decarboxylase family protein YurZ